MLKKMFACLLVIALFVSTSSSVFANSTNARSTSPTTSFVEEKTPVVISNFEEEPEIGTYGFKGFLVKQSLALIRVSVDKGGDVLAYVTKWLDKDAAKYITNNKSKITGAIKKVENWIDNATDVTQTTIKTKLNSELSKAGVPSKYSLQIADAVARTVTWLML